MPYPKRDFDYFYFGYTAISGDDSSYHSRNIKTVKIVGIVRKPVLMLPQNINM